MSDALIEIGQKLWLVDFMADYVMDTGSAFEGGDDDTHQMWVDAIYENAMMLKNAVTELKQAILLLSPEMAAGIAAAFANEDRDAKARGAASCMLANIQRKVSETKGGAA